jgi:hypothetical protein
VWEDRSLFESARGERARIELREYLHTHDRDGSIFPEKRLMLVMLEDALKCLSKYAETRNRRSRRVFEQTEQWVFASNNEGVFSFENVCDALGLNPAYIRKGVRRLAKNPVNELGQKPE